MLRLMATSPRGIRGRTSERELLWNAEVDFASVLMTVSICCRCDVFMRALPLSTRCHSREASQTAADAMCFNVSDLGCSPLTFCIDRGSRNKGRNASLHRLYSFQTRTLCALHCNDWPSFSLCHVTQAMSSNCKQLL